MPTARAPGNVNLRYETGGEGPPLLLISGTGHDHTFWSGQLPRLEKEFRRIVFDNRGVGESDAPPPGYSLAEYSLLGLYSHAYYDAHADELAAKAAWLAENSVPRAGWIGQLEATIRGDTLDRLHEIKVPTLVTASDLDLIVAPRHAEEIHSRIAGSRKIVLKGTGHVALIERPEEFARLCLDFLREADRAA